MEFNLFTGFLGLVFIWFLCSLFSVGPKSRTGFIRGEYNSRSIGVFWFLVLLAAGALIGGFIPSLAGLG